MSRLIRSAAASISMLLVVGAGHAQQHAVQWPLQLEADAPAHRLTLTVEVYAQLTDPGLGDLEVLNAAGEPVPFGPVPPPALPPSEPTSVSVPWFVLPPPPRGGTRDDTLRLRVERDADGRLRQLDASVPDSASATAAAGHDLLLDLSALGDVAVDALQFDWTRADDVSARFRVAGSDDLVGWNVLKPQAGLVDLQQGGHRLLRRDIELPATRHRYLLLSRLDGGAALQPTAVSARLADPARPAVDPFAWLELDAPGGSAEAGWTYRLPGPMRVEQVQVALGSANSVADVQLFSRDDDDAPWRPRGQGIAFRVDDSGSPIESDALTVHGVRDRQWRLLATPRLDRAPSLRVGHAPDQFVLLSRGDGPYRLVAGSADARRPAYPVERLLTEIGERRGGSEWQLPSADLGPMQPFAGDAALVGALPWQRWLLWGVLLSGAALVIGMVLKLVRSSGD